MSEKFGLDWREYDSVRMETFKAIMNYQKDREKKDNQKSNKKYGRH